MFQNPIVWLILQLLWLYFYVVIAAVLVSWLVVFNVINTAHPFVRQMLRLLDALTEPVFRQVRRVLPPIAGFDLSPVVVLLAIQFLQISVVWLADRLGMM